MTNHTRKAKGGDGIADQLVAKLPGVFRRPLSVEGRAAAIALGESVHRYVVDFSGYLKWAGLVRTVWPQICVCGYRGLTDKEMAPIISVAVRLGRPDIELWNAGPKRLEDRNVELSPAVLRDAISAERKRVDIPPRHTAVWWIARQRQVDVADIDPAIAAEMAVLSARALAGIGVQSQPATAQVVVERGARQAGRSSKRSRTSPAPAWATSADLDPSEDRTGTLEAAAGAGTLVKKYVEPEANVFGDDGGGGGGWRPPASLVEQAAKERSSPGTQTLKTEVDEDVFDQLKPAGL